MPKHVWACMVAMIRRLNQIVEQRSINPTRHSPDTSVAPQEPAVHLPRGPQLLGMPLDALHCLLSIFKNNIWPVVSYPFLGSLHVRPDRRICLERIWLFKRIVHKQKLLLPLLLCARLRHHLMHTRTCDTYAT